MRGPGKTRRFSGRTYSLGQTFRGITLDKDGKIEKEVPYEKRNEMAQTQASKLRRNGINARVVNGSGWTAVYIGMQTSGSMVQTTPKKQQKKAIVKFGPPVPDSMIKQAPTPTVSIAKEFGIGQEAKVPTVGEEDRASAQIVSVLLSQKTAQQLGMGTLDAPETVVIAGKESANVSDVQVLEKQELVDLLQTIPINTGKRGLTSWLKSLKSSQELEAYSKRDDVRKLALVLTDRAKPSIETLEGVKLTVVFTGAQKKPTYFQFADQLATKKVLEKKMKDEKANEFPESAWQAFSKRFKFRNA